MIYSIGKFKYNGDASGFPLPELNECCETNTTKQLLYKKEAKVVTGAQNKTTHQFFFFSNREGFSTSLQGKFFFGSIYFALDKDNKLKNITEKISIKARRTIRFK